LIGTLQIIIIFIYSISLGFGANYFQPDLSSLSRGQENPGSLNMPEDDTLRLIGIMAQFPLEVQDNPKTSGNGHFLNLSHEEYNHFYDSTIPRCDGFLIDRPPHNSLYFQKQLEAVGNYYVNVSDSNLFYSGEIIENPDDPNGYFTVSHAMEYYAKSDMLLAYFFTESIQLAKSDIINYFESKSFTPDNVTFIIFHAGLSQDFSYPSFDPTIYDLKSAYIDEEMMQGIEDPAEILGVEIINGILLPETQNIIYFDVVEDIFGNPDYGTDDLCDIQIGLTGIFAFLLGYELGLPEMFNPITGNPGIGYFGLMDHGSNNGRGVIPVPPSPWTRSLLNPKWSSIQELSLLEGTEGNYSLNALDIDNKVIKVDISENEYFLIENRNNWVEKSVDIDSLRRKYKRFDEFSGDSLLGHWFDALTNENEKFITDMLIKIDPQTQVITWFDHYDYGLPGSGILIWHINEPDQADINIGVNSDLYNRHIQIEEADGAQDIGKASLFPTWLFDPSIGTPLDFWFIGNKEYERFNPWNDEKLLFDNESSPDSRTTEGAESFLSIEILSEISDAMNIRVRFNEDIEIVNLSDTSVQYLGNAVVNNTGFVYYAKNDSIYKHSHVEGEEAIEIYNSSSDKILFSFEDSVFITDNQYFWFDTIGTGHSEYKTPFGYIIDYNSPDTASISLISSDSSLAFGDLDQDGLDEIITIENGNIIARNSNGTLLNGFPANGGFSGVPLISNILPTEYGSDIGKPPEIISREGDDIVILSNKGERLHQLSSYDIDQPLAMVPFWRGDTTIALIDGSRLFLFDLDVDHSYWLNPRSRPSGFPLSTGVHEQNISQKFRKQAYNYPNPITDGSTIFRFYVSSTETTEVQVKIYNAAGYLVQDDLIKDDLTPYEFNEIQWNKIQVDAGLYFAEIKPNVGSSELVRLVVIK